jgi:5'-nucleotidase
MHILCTNDDGVYAPGLLALVMEIQKLGKVTILAPDRNWSATGHNKTLNRPLRVKHVVLADDTPALASDGAPSDCVALALLGLVPEPIDLVVSGINPHANVGHDVTYSGTVTAAMEAVIAGVPAMAVSLDGPPDGGKVDYAPAAQIARLVAELVLKNGLPPGILLNVNVPELPLEKLSGYRITRQGLRIYRDELVIRDDPRGSPYYWIGGDTPTGLPEAGTDFGALAGGFVSITPLHLDMTAHHLEEPLANWSWPAAGAEANPAAENDTPCP